MAHDLLTIGEFSRLVGVTPSALRYYDDVGLLVPGEFSAQAKVAGPELASGTRQVLHAIDRSDETLARVQLELPTPRRSHRSAGAPHRGCRAHRRVARQPLQGHGPQGINNVRDRLDA